MSLESEIRAAVQEAVRPLQEELARLRSVITPTQEWYSLRQAAELKCGIEGKRGFYGTLANKPWLRPRNGQVLGGKVRYHRQDVMAWLSMADEDLAPKETRRAS